jgi:pimeloyl-ACP methyl ester carboxylesterase
LRILLAAALISMSWDSNAETKFATSRDGARIAFDVTGSGPAVMLLHGGGQTRKSWHDAGYVSRLAREFTVIAVDLRGNGESDRPEETGAYAVDRLCDDLIAVADEAGASRFALWGFSYGANIGRYLAARSDRVSAMIYIGIPFGAAAAGAFRQYIVDLQAKWMPVVEKAKAGTLEPASLPEPDRARWDSGVVPWTLAWLGAMLDYPPVEPSDLKCETLWLSGSFNEGAISSMRAYEGKLEGTKVTILVVPGLDHPQELSEIDRVFEEEAAFTREHTR